MEKAGLATVCDLVSGVEVGVFVLFVFVQLNRINVVKSAETIIFFMTAFDLLNLRESQICCQKNRSGWSGFYLSFKRRF